MPTNVDATDDRVGIARKWARAAGGTIQVLWGFFPARGIQVNAFLALAALALAFFASADWLMNASAPKRQLGTWRFLAVFGALVLAVALWFATEPSPPDRLLDKPWTTSAEIAFAPNGGCPTCNNDIKVDDAGVLYAASSPGQKGEPTSQLSLAFTDQPVVEVNNPAAGTKVPIPEATARAGATVGFSASAIPAESTGAADAPASGPRVTVSGGMKDGRADPTTITVMEAYKGRIKIYAPTAKHQFSIRSGREHVFTSGQRAFLVRLTRVVQDTPAEGRPTVYRFEFDVRAQPRSFTLRERFEQMRNTARSLVNSGR